MDPNRGAVIALIIAGRAQHGFPRNAIAHLAALVDPYRRSLNRDKGAGAPTAAPT